MERIDIRDMNKAKAQNLALKLFKGLRPNEALVVISDNEPKLIYSRLKDQPEFNKDSYHVNKKKDKYITEILKKK